MTDIVAHVFGIVDHPSLDTIDPAATKIHITGTMTRKLIEFLLEKAPHVKTIQATASQEKKLTAPLRNFLGKRGVTVQIGYWRAPDPSAEPNSTSKDFAARKKILENLPDEAKKRLEELSAIGHPGVGMLRKFYGLGCGRVGKNEIARACGLRDTAWVIRHMNTVLAYLNLSFDVGETAQEAAHSLAVVLEKRKRIGQKIRLPKGLSTKGTDLLAFVTAHPERFTALRQRRPKQYQSLALRLGLHPQHPRVFRTYKEVGVLLGNKTGPYAWMLVKKAIEFLKNQPAR